MKICVYEETLMNDLDYAEALFEVTSVRPTVFDLLADDEAEQYDLFA